VHLIEYSNDDLPGSTAILTGAIGDFGEAVSVYPNGTVVPVHNSEYNFALTQGSSRINVAALDKNIGAAYIHFPEDTRTCSGYVSVTWKSPAVAGSGTGLYEGTVVNFNLGCNDRRDRSEAERLRVRWVACTRGD
jgi:hypothetical protein